MARSPASPAQSPSSPSLNSRHNSPSSTPRLDGARRAFGRATASSQQRNGFFGSNGGGDSGRTSPTSTPGASLPPSPKGPQPPTTRETTISFSSAGSGSARPSMESPSHSGGSGLAPSPAIGSTSVFGWTGSKKLEKRGPPSRAASSSSSNRAAFSASELDGTFDLGAATLVSPGPPSLTSASSLYSLDKRRGLEPVGASEAIGLKRNGWYGETLPKGAMEKQRYPWMGDGLDIPYWLSYGHGSQNWDALLTSSLFVDGGTGTTAFAAPVAKPGADPLPAPSPPRRVLDIGCGSSSLWSIMQAGQPGWETTQFVGLDIAPPDIPRDHLPYDISSRLSYVLHNFMEPLPFDDGRFDFVRIASIGLGGVPEDLWAQLIEEAARVLTPGGHLEVFEHNFAVMRQRPPMQTPNPLRAMPEDDPDAVIDDCFDAVLEQRFINPHTLGIIPFQLALNAKVQSSRLTNIPLPSRPPAPKQFGTDSPAHSSSSLPQLYLHAYADRFSSASHSIAASAASRRQRNMSRGVEQPQRYDMLHAELDEAVRAWATDLRARAGLAQVVGNLWGWECSMDVEMRKVLDEQLPFFEKRIQSFDEQQADWETQPALEYRRAQLAFARGEAIVELRKVKTRLGMDQQQETGDLGVLEMGTWVGRATP